MKRRDSGYGLLVPAATVTDYTVAQGIRELLRANNIRSTAGPAPAVTAWGGHVVVLVFPEDSQNAYRLLCQHTH